MEQFKKIQNLSLNLDANYLGEDGNMEYLCSGIKQLTSLKVFKLSVSGNEIGSEGKQRFYDSDSGLFGDIQRSFI